MPSELTMPQLSDTMTEGTLIKWHKKEGDKVQAGDELADIETDKATMPMEAFDDGVLALIVAKEGDKIPVGATIGVLALTGENPAEIKANYKPSSPQAPKAAAAESSQPAPAKAAPAKPAQAAPTPAPTAPKPTPAAAKKSSPAPIPASKPHYQFDLVVIGGGPAGYAAAIRAGQLKQRTLCIEREHLGGICLNWGCIPTKALLDNGALIRRIREHGDDWGLSFDNLKVDFSKIIARSRGISEKLSKGIAHLLKKYEVKHELATGQLLSAHRVKITTPDGKSREVTANHIILATGARPRSLPGMEIDRKTIISSHEAMSLAKQPEKLAIIGAGAIGCEFADFYNSIGTQVEIVEMAHHILPIEDTDSSLTLERLFTKRGIKVHTKAKTERIEKTSKGVKLHVTSESDGAFTIDASLCLMAVGVTGNVEDVAAPQANLELFKNHIKVDAQYRTNIENVWAIGDVIGPPWLAHVAHHEAVVCVERITGFADHTIDYKYIPGCTYTHPQIASLGLTERKAREEGREIRIGKFPFAASGRALAAGEPDGFVKLIFDSKYGELLGAHLVGENVTELLGELILAQKLEATEETILQLMHPHPTLSEAVMEAAGVADGRAIHL